jgi:hypothetical protein
MHYSSGPRVIPHPLPEVNLLMGEILTPRWIGNIFLCDILKKTSGGDGDDPGPQLLGHLICLYTLIINIYGLGVGISTIIKFTSGRGCGMTPRGLSYKAFNLPSHSDHKLFMIRVTRQIKFLIAQAPGSYPTPYLK